MSIPIVLNLSSWLIGRVGKIISTGMPPRV
jgi:hypothetical protein